MDEKTEEIYLKEIENLKAEIKILGEELIKSRGVIYQHEKFFINQRIAIQLLLDHVDYTNGACSVTEMVGGALPRIIIAKAREALRDE